MHKADDLTTILVVMNSGNLNFLEPSGPLQACNVTALPLTIIRNKHIANYRNSALIFNKTSNFKVAIIEMYPRIPWDLIAHFVNRCNTRTLC